jgi:hypothetical protein
MHTFFITNYTKTIALHPNIAFHHPQLQYFYLSNWKQQKNIHTFATFHQTYYACLMAKTDPPVQAVRVATRE